MGNQGSFECLRCATCCRNLIENKAGVLRGLTLTESEKHLFPPQTISPKLAVGENGPTKVILHQLNVNCCPHVTAENVCPIYEKRPLMCMSFPMVAGAISNRCHIFSYRKIGMLYSEPYHMKEQLEASEKLTKHIENSVRKNHRKGLVLWEYDLNTKKWHYVTRYNSPS